MEKKTNLIDLHTTAVALGRSDVSIYQMVRQGDLTPIVKRPMMFNKDEVDALAQELNGDLPTIPTMTLGEVAEMFGVTRSATYNWRRSGELVPIYNGHRGRPVLYSKADVEEFAKRHNNHGVGRPAGFNGMTGQYVALLERMIRKNRQEGNEELVTELTGLRNVIVKKSKSISKRLASGGAVDDE